MGSHNETPGTRMTRARLHRRAARPIPLDDREVDKMVKELVKVAERGLRGLRHGVASYESLGDNLKYGAPFSVTTIGGEKVKIMVQLASRDIRSDKLVVAGSTAQVGRYPLVTLQLNGSHILGDWLNAHVDSIRFRKELRSVLKHEITHVLDYEVRPESEKRNKRRVRERGERFEPGEIPTMQQLDRREYYNDPYEVRARMRDIVDETKDEFGRVLMRANSLNEAVRESLDGSEIFRKMEPHLTRSNRKKLLDAVYRELRDFYETNYEGIFEGVTATDRRRESAGKYDHIDFKPPAGVAEEAQRAIDWRDEHGDEVKGGTRVGWTRASQLAKRENLSPETVKRMHNFFNRHEKNKSVAPEHKGEPWKDNGRVAWLLWGGDAGQSWASKVVRQMDAADEKAKSASRRSVNAARPIRLPKRAISKLAKRLAGRVAKDVKRGNPDEPLGDRYGIQDSIEIESVMGDEFEVLVQLRSKTSNSPFFVLGGGSGKTSRSKKPAIVIEINGRYPADAYAVPSLIEDDLEDLILHELTHQADKYQPEGLTTRRVPTEEELDMDEYLNEPHEVRARMQEVVHQVLKSLPDMLRAFEPNEAIRYALKGSDAWRYIEGHLDRRNKKKVLNAVYREAMDAIERGKVASEDHELPRAIERAFSRFLDGFWVSDVEQSPMNVKPHPEGNPMKREAISFNIPNKFKNLAKKSRWMKKMGRDWRDGLFVLYSLATAGVNLAYVTPEVARESAEKLGLEFDHPDTPIHLAHAAEEIFHFVEPLGHTMMSFLASEGGTSRSDTRIARELVKVARCLIADTTPPGEFSDWHRGHGVTLTFAEPVTGEEELADLEREAEKKVKRFLKWAKRNKHKFEPLWDRPFTDVQDGMGIYEMAFELKNPSFSSVRDIVGPYLKKRMGLSYAGKV